MIRFSMLKITNIIEVKICEVTFGSFQVMEVYNTKNYIKSKSLSYTG
jgi:hypothetical protein